MDIPTLESLRNFRMVANRWPTSGMPTEAHLRALAEGGVQTVINLALPTSDHALPDEASVVIGLGMEYVHIPVDFENPRRSDYDAFAAAMDARPDQRLFLHCAANYRVSVFLAAYRIRHLGTPPDAASADLHAVWEPDDVWRRFLHRLLSEA